MNGTPFYSLRRLRNAVGYARDFGPLGAWDVIRSRGRERASVRVLGIRTPIRYRPGTSDFLTLRQILGRRESLPALESRPGFIIDAGANIGCTSLLYANRWPEAAILAVEPDGGNCDLFEKNLRDYPNVTLVRGAVWPHGGALRISNPGSEPWSRRVAPDGVGNWIRGRSIPEPLDLAGRSAVDLLKLDIEGAERELFSHGTSEWIGRVGTLLVELHDRMRPGCSAALDAALAGQSHRRSRSGEYEVVHFNRAGA